MTGSRKTQWGYIVLLSSLLLVLLVGLRSGAAARSPVPGGQKKPDEAEDRGQTLLLPVVGRYAALQEPGWGVQTHHFTEENAQLISELGARWVRLFYAWSSVEPENVAPEEYRWSGQDATITRASAHNLGIVLTLGSQPEWAATYAQGPVTDTADLVEFFGAWVERYDGDGVDDAPGSPVVEYFELYNEPDNAEIANAAHGAWGYWGHNGAGYADLLRTLYPVVKAASPRANLVVGGLALDWFEEEGGIFDSGFLDDVLAACQGHACFDVMNFHYYPLWGGNWDQYGPGILGKTHYVRNRLAAYGFPDKPIMCTEFGLGSIDSFGGPERQARYVVEGYTRAAAADLSVVIWYTLEDGIDRWLPGLVDNDVQAKLSYQAYGQLAANLSMAEYLRELSVAETGSDAVAGYIFSREGRRVDVVWTEDSTFFDWQDNADAPVMLSLPAKELRVQDPFGNEAVVVDGDDGTVDGRTTVWVDGTPLYIEYVQ